MSGPPIYRLLPQVYRDRDAQGDFALKALTGLLDESRAAVEQDIAGLYRNWFVETCEPWVLPYLADLTGRPAPEAGSWDPRALVADAVAMARRKGTRPATEHLLAAVSGWPVQVGLDATARMATALFWPEPVYAVRQVAPQCEGAGRYRFHPMGVDCPLFAAPRPYTGIEAPFVAALDAPVALAGPAGAAVLARATEILVEDANGAWQAVPVEGLVVGDLSEWRSQPGGSAQAVVDPVLGRFLLLDPAAQGRPLAVSFAYAAAGNVGGGAYEREMERPDDSTWLAYVHSEAGGDAGTAVFRTLAEALEAWRSIPDHGLIRILDSGAYDVDGLAVGAAPLVCPTDPNAPRRLRIEALSGEAPALHGALAVGAGATGPHLALIGLWIDGQVTLEGRIEARIEHCSIHPVTARSLARPGSGPIAAISVPEADGALPKLSLHACLTGPLQLAKGAPLAVSECVVDGFQGGMAIVGNPDAALARTTLLGGAELRSLDALDTILGDPVSVAPDQACSVRFCFVPAGVMLPSVSDSVTGPADHLFQSIDFGQPGYARLRWRDVPALGTGASNGSQIGLFNAEHSSQRESLMAEALEQSLPVGMGSRLEPQSLVR